MVILAFLKRVLSQFSPTVLLLPVSHFCAITVPLHPQKHLIFNDYLHENLKDKDIAKYIVL